MKFQRVADASLAVWGDETVLYHHQSGNTYLFQSPFCAPVLQFCLSRQIMDESELSGLTPDPQLLSAMLQQLLDIRLIRTVE